MLCEAEFGQIIGRPSFSDFLFETRIITIIIVRVISLIIINSNHDNDYHADAKQVITIVSAPAAIDARYRSHRSGALHLPKTQCLFHVFVAGHLVFPSELSLCCKGPRKEDLWNKG